MALPNSLRHKRRVGLQVTVDVFPGRTRRFTNLHEDPRWLPFLRKLGMAPEQLAAIKFDVSVPK